MSCSIPARASLILWSVVGELSLTGQGQVWSVVGELSLAGQGQFDTVECCCGMLLASCLSPTMASLTLWSVVGELPLTGHGQFDVVECCWRAASHRPWPV